MIVTNNLYLEVQPNNMIEIPCLVCDKLYDGTTHCSVTACRACAVFFKRAQKWDAIPVCKVGNNKCNFDDSKRVMCSSCRYRRCTEIGMEEKQTVRSSKAGSKPKQQSTVFKVLPLKMNIELPILVFETMPTLKQFCYHYAINANIRKDHEIKLLSEDKAELFEMPGTRRMALMTQSRSNRLWANSLPDFIIFLNRSFPALATIDAAAQDTLLHLLMFYFFDLATSYKTYKTLNDVNTTKILCSEMMYSDVNNVESYLDHNLKIDPMDLQTIKEYFSTLWRDYLRATLRVLHRIQITDVEYLAVTGLLIWDEESFTRMPHLSSMAAAHRTLIYKDLDYYYRNVMKMDNYVERVTNLKELIRTIKNSLLRMMEGMDFLRTFNYYEGNAQMWQATKKIVSIIEEDVE